MNHLTKNKPFWALFGTQFLGAFNDNFFRTALVTLVTYHLVIYSETVKSLFVSAAFGLFMLPFFVFSPLAGQLADRYDKAKIIRWVKASEILIVSLSSYGFIHKNPYFLLAALFCMGIHSTFFGPAKYSILPDLLPPERLLKGNGYIEAGTFLAIMLGTLTGALMIHWNVSLFIVSFQLLVVSLLGFLMSWQIPSAPQAAPRLKIHLSWTREMKHLFRYARKDVRIFRTVIGISWFWLVGAVLLAQLPPLAKGILQVEEGVFIFLLFLFTIGIGAGSIFCNWLFKGEITTKHVPLLAFFMIPFLFDIASFNAPLATTPTSLYSFLFSFQGTRLTADIISLSFIGGLFIVPLYAFIQSHVTPSQRSQIIAFNNIVNAGFMVFASFTSFCLLSLNVSIPILILLTGIGQVIVTLYVVRILPDDVLRNFLYTLLRLLFRLEVHGLENYKKSGRRTIFIANHTSYLDALLLSAILPEKPVFAINLFTAQKWWVKPFLVLAKVFPIDPLYPYALRDVIEEAKKGHKVLIFPEGRITLTGSLMKIYEGPGMVAEKAEASLLPIRIEGAQYTFFSLLRGQLPRKLFPKITVSILSPVTLSVEASLVGRARRRALSEQLYDVMANMIFETSPIRKTLFSALVESRYVHGSSSKVIEDVTRKILSYRELFLKIFTLSRRMARKTQPHEIVGLMLPNTNSLIISFWALQAIGRVPALLNYTSGSAALLMTCQLSRVRKVYTSRLFIEKARLQDAIELMKHNKIHLYFLEDEAKKIRFTDKIWGIFGSLFPKWLYKTNQTPEDQSVILFTSGSEDTPKGVVLSHRNLLANCYQLAAVVDFNSLDKVLNVLPIFHAFGLTAGMLLPLLSGIQTFHYVSPLHYRAVAELIYDTNATILFGTDTFLFGYGRVAHPYDFHTIRYVFAGAEKLKAETSQLWFTKFGIRLFEGYGTTETSPVLSVNTTMHYKAGTVGRFLPSINYRLESMEGIAEGKRLLVKGPNIMLGHLRGDSNGKLIIPPEGWYDTGDIVTLDPEGYIRLVGRANRFAKVGGENVSLAAVEEAIARLWPEHHHAVLARPDPKKGERLILYTTYPFVERSILISFWKEQGLPEFSCPRIIHTLSSLPLLGSGKVDYRALEARET
ncbi:MAG: acyl-[ACP]--phospholipid O-acyltransferase [Alphaproteobacteria bacterium]|nr:acyl-[ACP]--phospholipid O-acyltransferase [Alphaproteobacteria bacterium]